MLYSHGENTRTCPHSRTLAPTAPPASKTSGSIPREASWAAAARPTGPAPMTATTCGFSVMAGSRDEDIEEVRCVKLAPPTQDIKFFRYHVDDAHPASPGPVLRTARHRRPDRWRGGRARAGLQG